MTALTEYRKRRWKSLLGYGLLLLGICLLLYYYREVSLGMREAARFFRNKSRVNQLISSFGPYAPLAFLALQILQVLFAPIPGRSPASSADIFLELVQASSILRWASLWAHYPLF